MNVSCETISLNGILPAFRDDFSFCFAAAKPAADDFIFCPVTQISSDWITFSVSFGDTGKYSFAETFKRLSEIVISVGIKIRRKLCNAVKSLKKIQMPRMRYCAATLPLRL